MADHERWWKILDVYHWGQDDETFHEAVFKDRMPKRAVFMACLPVAAIFFTITCLVYWAGLVGLQNAREIVYWPFLIFASSVYWVFQIVLDLFDEWPWFLQVVIGFLFFYLYFLLVGFITYKHANYQNIRWYIFKTLWLYFALGLILAIMIVMTLRSEGSV